MNRRVLLGSVLAAGGCSLLPQRRYVEPRDWPLDVRRPVSLPPDPHGPVLLLRAVRAAPGTQAQGLQRIEADGSVHTDYYERWSVPPPDAVEQQLCGWLEASGLFAGVLPPGSRAHADLALEVELLTLIAAPAQGISRVSLGVVLVDVRPSPSRLLLQAHAMGAAPLAGLDAPELARSGRAALAAAFGDVERTVAAGLPRRTQRPLF